MANRQSVQDKISYLQEHRDTTHVVADFDGTLTQYFDEHGTSRPSIISLLRDENILDDDYTVQAKAFHAHYGPIEHDTTLPLDARQAACVERWTRHKELLMVK